MKNNSLTIIIPFLNEKNQVELTLRSIAKAFSKRTKIILINDGSDDGYNYFQIAKKYKCEYIVHNTRQGVACSRMEGVEKCQTEYFLFLDAHMECWGKRWDKKLISIMKKNKKCCLCCRTVCITQKHQPMPTNCSIGATIDLYNGLKAKWCLLDKNPLGEISEIECILGAGYCMSKNYFLELHGLTGLVGFGSDEEMLSIKIARTDGKCLIVKNWLIGHLYRTSTSGTNAVPPYHISRISTCYNKILLAELFFEGEEKAKILSGIEKWYGTTYNLGLKIIDMNRAWIEQEKSEMEEIFQKAKEK